MAPYADDIINMNRANFFYFKHFIKIFEQSHSGTRNKSFNSHEWLKRRDADIYVEKSKRDNYRCRSAYKLLEIDDRFKLLKPGLSVLDVGAAPGSWSQVLADRTNSNGKDSNKPRGMVIAIDLSHIYSIDGVILLPCMDFTNESSQKKILEILGPRKLDFVFSDMAPNATGIKSLDQETILNLIYPVLIFSVKHLKSEGGCLIKIWEGKHKQLVDEIKRFFKFTNLVRPQATYTSSSEIYVLGRKFLGLKSTDQGYESINE